MEAAGDIYLGKHSGWYSVRDEAYFDESELTTGEGGRKFAPSGAPVEWQEVDSYFFRLSKYQDKLLQLYKDQPNFIGPETRRNEVVSFVSGGLKDLSISRDTFSWGVPVPGDPKHVMYVWVDALTNYITACGYPDESNPRWQYWPADVHIIGKDIVRFHAVIWPALLMSAGIALPKRVFGHGFLTNRGEKMSKSTGNVLDPIAMAEQYGRDPLRYFFLREVPFGQDGSYSHEAIVGRLNADLANDLGNLAQRSLSMVNKNCAAQVPARGPLAPEDDAILAQAYGLLAESRSAMADFQNNLALNAIWRAVAETNRYFAGQAPWALKKTDPARMETVLYVTAEVLRVIGLLIQPVMPDSGAKLLDLLAVPADARDFAAADAASALKPGTPLPEPKGLFPRYVEPETGQGA
jgi:methionyl-tRNA synthetase